MPWSRKFRLLLASARIANIPSVASNVWLGVALGWMAWTPQFSPWPIALPLIASGVLLYLAGNFLNDWHDRDWDATRRPERALPQGAFPPALYLALGAGCGAGGLGAAWLTHPRAGIVAGLILACILIYTRWHKRSAWAIVPMGLCRALLPALFFSIWPLDLQAACNESAVAASLEKIAWFAPHAFALLAYVAGLSWLARSEQARRKPIIPQVLLVASGLIMAAPTFQIEPSGLALIGLVPFSLWLSLCLTRFSSSAHTQISGLLAGLPLLDWVALLPFFLMFQGKPGAFEFTILLLPPLAFLSGRLLQRLAPAT